MPASKKIHVLWDRVKKTPTSKKEIERRESNNKTFSNEHFKTCCNNAGVELTRRQASKWNNSKGLAFKSRNHKKEE